MANILFFHPYNDYTGSTRVLSNIIESDFSSQHVNVITIDNNKGFLSDNDRIHVVKILYLQYKGRNIPLLTALLWRTHAVYLALRYGLKSDVFYINTILPAYAAIVAMLCRKKIIYHVHEKFIHRSFYIKVAEFVFNHVDAKRIYVSKYLMKQYKNRCSCESLVKYNKLSKSFLSQVKITPVELHKRNRIIMITSLNKAKGIFTYITVAKEMPNYTFRLLVSADIDKISTFLSGVDVPENLKIIPSQKNIHPYLQSSDLLLNLSIPQFCIETFGMTILEAMVYGIPAIVPNVGGPLELVTDGYNGFCINVTDIEEIKTKIKYALDKDNYEKLFKHAIKKAADFI